jgi:GT2 family glycosyltransferase
MNLNKSLISDSHRRMMKLPLISIVIVNWNGRKWLNRCLTTLSSQTYRNIEIIVVDNASTDDSVKFISQHFPQVKLIKNRDNRGFAYANNVGIKYSKGEYILLINNDTWVEKKFIQEMYAFYISHSFDVIAPIEHKYYDKDSFIYYPTLDITGFPAFNHTYSKRIMYLTGVCLFFQKKVYLDTLGLDQDFFMYFEEADWFWRLSLLNRTYSSVSNLSVYHAAAGGTSAGIRYNIFLWRNQNIPQMLMKNYSFLTLFIVMPLYIIQNLIEIIFFILLLKPGIAYSYILGWIFNIKIFKKTMSKRKWVQNHRKVSDIVIFGKMYLGSAKLIGLINYFKLKYAK